MVPQPLRCTGAGRAAVGAGVGLVPPARWSRQPHHGGGAVVMVTPAHADFVTVQARRRRRHGRRMEVVAKLGRPRFVRSIQPKKPALGIASV